MSLNRFKTEFNKYGTKKKAGKVTPNKLTKYFNSGEELVTDEFRTYLAEPLFDFSDSKEALKYWERNKDTYPSLSRMAVDYCSIPASSAPVERLFSKCGHIHTKKRNRTSPSFLEMQCLLNYWRNNKF